MPAKWLHDRFRRKGPIYRSINFPLFCFAQIIVFLTVLHMYLQAGSRLPAPILLLDMLLFSLLFWLFPRKTARQKQIYYAVQSALVSFGFIQNFLFVYLFLLLAGQAMFLFSVRIALLWTGAFFLLTLWGNYYLHPYAQGMLSPPINTVLVTIGFVTFVTLCQHVYQARVERRRADDFRQQIVQAQDRLEQYAIQTYSLTVAEERNRLARELHDTLGHRLTVSIVQLEGAERLITQDPQQSTRMLGATRAQLTEGLNELRHTLGELNKPESTNNDLIKFMEKTIDEFATIDINLHVQLPDRLPPLLDEQIMAVHRTVQETLTNTLKHAQAYNVWLTLEVTTDTLVLTMRNDGRDFIPPSNGRGYGLQGIRKRAAELRGSLHVTKPEEGGTLVTLSLPIQKAEPTVHA